MKILIVDDEETNNALIKAALKDIDYDLVVAHDGEEGIALAKAEMPDVIILDVMMAQVDSGFDICRKLKTEDRTKAIPTLMLTGIDKKYPFHLGKSGSDSDWMPYDDFLDKPVQANELVEHVQRLLRGEDKEK